MVSVGARVLNAVVWIGFSGPDFVGKFADRIAVGHVSGAMALGYYQKACLVYDNCLDLVITPLQSVAMVREIAEIVGEVFPGCTVSFGPPSLDNRSYRVSFDKIRKHLPTFKCRWDARRGARQLLDLFRRVDMTEEVFQYRAFTRLK